MLYHVVFIPKCRRKTLYVGLRKHLGEVFRRLAEQKESRIEEGHLMSDQVHINIPSPIRVYDRNKTDNSTVGPRIITLRPKLPAVAANSVTY